MKHLPCDKKSWTLAFVALLAVLYVVSYFPMVTRTSPLGSRRSTPSGDELVTFFPEYRINSNLVALFYCPIHRLDRRVRSEFWEFAVPSRFLATIEREDELSKLQKFSVPYAK